MDYSHDNVMGFSISPNRSYRRSGSGGAGMQLQWHQRERNQPFENKGFSASKLGRYNEHKKRGVSPFFCAEP